MAELFASFGAGVTTLSCLTTELEESNTIFLAKETITNHIMFIHHFTSIGGTRTMPISRLFILSGITSHAFPAQINKEYLFDDTECQLPLWSTFKALKDSQDVTNLAVRGNADLKKFRMCTPVPPFLASALIN